MKNLNKTEAELMKLIEESASKTTVVFNDPCYPSQRKINAAYSLEKKGLVRADIISQQGSVGLEIKLSLKEKKGA